MSFFDGNLRLRLTNKKCYFCRVKRLKPGTVFGLEATNNNEFINVVRDVDGNHYDAVRIGDQVWMKTNLRTKHFRDRSPIPVGGASSDKPFVYEPMRRLEASAPTRRLAQNKKVDA